MTTGATCQVRPTTLWWSAEPWPGIWHIVATLPPTSVGWTDHQVEPGERYRYRAHTFRAGEERYRSEYSGAVPVVIGPLPVIDQME